jgi:hypothetical protein
MLSIKQKLQYIKQAIRNSAEIKTRLIENRFVFEKEILINQMRQNSLHLTKSGITNEKYFDNKNVIVSLTSHGKRIYDVFLVIESLLEQTIKPNKIILWLAEDEFTMDNIPVILKKMQNRGLIIEFCEDIKSYKKLIPALKKYPNDIIITADDDVIYQYDLIENLLNSYKQNPELIHFCRGRRIKFKDDNNLENYMKWDFCRNDYEISKLNISIGIGGILYPPNVLYKDVTNKEFFLSLAPNADDVWLYAMALKNGILSKKAYTHNFYGSGIDYIDITYEAQYESALFHINKTKNDEQINVVFSKYGIYELLNNDK